MYDQPGQRILIADDDDLVLAWLRRVFEEDGHTVDSTGSGTKALELARVNKYDLMVLDVGLPGESGFAVTRAVRAMGNRTPILIMTGLASDEDVVTGLDAGADDYLTKPASIGVLRARARAVTRRMYETPGEEINFADLKLSRTTFKARGPVGEAELTAREFALLDCLIANAPRVMSRERLLHDVWGYDFDPGTNVLEVALSRVRVRLQDVTTSVRLRTLRGIGVVAEVVGNSEGANAPS